MKKKEHEKRFDASRRDFLRKSLAGCF